MYRVIERMSKIKNEKKTDWAKKNRLEKNIKRSSDVACHLSVSYPSNQLANSGFNLRHSLQPIHTPETIYSEWKICNLRKVLISFNMYTQHNALVDTDYVHFSQK